MEDFRSFKRFRRVVKCYNCASNDALASFLPADMFEPYLVVKYYTNVMNHHRRSHTSLLA